MVRSRRTKVAPEDKLRVLSTRRPRPHPPGCEVPGYFCEVDHVTDYATCRTTYVNDLTFGCGGHHPLVKPGGRRTRKHANGDTEWIPPPHLDRGQPRTNTFHHPEKLLREGDDEDPD